jgi:hypothetical protein
VSAVVTPLVTRGTQPDVFWKSLDWLDFEGSERVQGLLDHQVHFRVLLEAGEAPVCLGKLELHELPSKAV